MKFIIIGNPRSGTTTLFNSFKSIGLKGLNEPFNKIASSWIRNYTELKINRRTGPREFYSCLDEFDKKYDFIKHLLYELKHYKNNILAESYKTIFIYRKNIFESALSNQIAKETKTWNAAGMSPDYNNYQLIINDRLFYNSCRYYTQKNQEIINLYNKNQKKAILINYENLFYNDTDKCLNLIERLTGLSLPQSAFSIDQKMNKSISYNRILNIEEIKNKYKEYGRLEHDN